MRRLLLSLLLAPVLLLAATPVPLPDDPACTEVDRGFMIRANELAAEAVKQGNTPFGAVLVVDGKIVAECSNTAAVTHDPTRHAELSLISTFTPKLDRDQLARATLYASTEPCTMCSGAIANAGLAKVVYGVTEAQFLLFLPDRAAKSPLTCREILSRSRPEVEVAGPLMEKEGLVLHQAFWPEAIKKWSEH